MYLISGIGKFIPVKFFPLRARSSFGKAQFVVYRCFRLKLSLGLSLAQQNYDGERGGRGAEGFGGGKRLKFNQRIVDVTREIWWD